MSTAGPVELDDFDWLDGTGEPALQSWDEAVLASLFTDARHPEAPEGDRRGWWADAYGPKYGSRLWRIIDRGKLRASTAADAAAAADAALFWMIAQGAAKSVKASAVRASERSIQLAARIERAGEPIEVVVTI